MSSASNWEFPRSVQPKPEDYPFDLEHSLAARVISKQEYAGYWEYVLDEAIFTAPAHPNWGGTALVGPTGDLIGIGSLQLQHMAQGGRLALINMIVPTDLLTPILGDL